ncbi:nitrogen permease regulator 2 [Eremomyces bilateralis CBS 781.70]|uniref:Nitrogen permease regulator 2 n=1 Tax=Eremomyces bilateralis CBS 781.70 TaxID=1392243 RepID=A0A6G1G270_9PEZI|nr:nitrogen permease regulator 2 [Eremomyces bilateralis CBS 781.70]KAF1812205.1 nitrogen permease regulator 2 [Eremomyces bilateralis CBS 781.70]
MIKAVFFTRFHETKGSRVLHQVPAGAIVPFTDSPSASFINGENHPPPSPRQAPLFDFNSISEYIIPRPPFCDRPLTICINKLRIVSHPVCIDDLARYDRKIYIFNFAVVIEEDVEMSGYVSVVRKLARLFRNLEEMNGFLSKEEEVVEESDRSGLAGRRGRGKVYALCEMIMEDLNNYCECMIPIDDANTVNLKLFPPQPPPPPVPSYVVPLLTITLPHQTISTDLTLLRILPSINGINSVARIADLADVDLSLTRKAIQHLLYYGCVLLLDIFQFGATYAPTSEISSLVEDDDMVQEGINYITVPDPDSLSFPSRINSSDRLSPSRSGSDADSTAPSSPPHGQPSLFDPNGISKPLDPTMLIQLYTSLGQGKTLRTWVVEHEELLRGLDVRRLITFGIIKGFLYRVHKYVVATGASGRGEWGNGRGGRAYAQTALDAIDSRATSVVRGFATPGGTRENGHGGAAGSLGMGLPLAKYVDGTHCLDETCTELRMGEKEVMGRLREAFGEIVVIHR